MQKTLNKLADESGDALQVFVCHRETEKNDFEAFRESELLASKAADINKPTFPQRVIIATNYAETSVTFSNIRYVIDSGLILQPTWNAKICSFTYNPKWHSRAGCTQRKGRVGRTQSGEYIRLYSSKAYDSEACFPKQTPPDSQHVVRSTAFYCRYKRQASKI